MNLERQAEPTQAVVGGKNRAERCTGRVKVRFVCSTFIRSDTMLHRERFHSYCKTRDSEDSEDKRLGNSKENKVTMLERIIQYHSSQGRGLQRRTPLGS
jgi:hypothetical protein